MNTFKYFYTSLAMYYEVNGDKKKAVMCRSHFLTKLHKLDHCYPNCDYFDIAEAYATMQDRLQAFQFRELAYEHQLTSLSQINQAKLFLDLYNGYLDTSLGNNTTKANSLSGVIMEHVYNYLMTVNYSKVYSTVYYDAIDFFKAKDMDSHAIRLQYKLLKAIKKQYCTRRGSQECETVIEFHLRHAWQRECYYLAIGIGKKLLSQRVRPTLATMATSIVGQSYYQLGNYSASQVWLKRALQLVYMHLNDEYPLELQNERADICFCLIMSGDVFNVFCYGYIVKKVIALFATAVTNIEYWPSLKPLTERSRVTSVTERGFSYVVWSQINERFQYLYTAEWPWRILETIILCTCCVIAMSCWCILSYMSLGISVAVPFFMHLCFSKQQISCCFTVCNCLGTVTHIITFIAFIFVLGLDRLY